MDFNGTRAALRAKYSPRGVATTASRLLRNAKVVTVINDRMDELSMSAAESQMRLTSMARGTMESFFDFSRPVVGGVPHINLTTEQALQHLHLIKRIEQAETVVRRDDEETVIRRTTRIELHDAKDALTKLAKIRGLFIDRKEVSGPDREPIPVDAGAVHAAFLGRIADIAARQRENGTGEIVVSPRGNGA